MTDVPADPVPLAALPADPLRGRFLAPGDRAIAQRALLLAGLTIGRTQLTGMPASPALTATATALRQLGVRVAEDGATWQVHGLGPLGLLQADDPLLAPDAETATLLLGLLAPYAFTSYIDGSVSSDIRAALAVTAASLTVSEEAPMALHGSLLPAPFATTIAPPSEALKSALLLAALQVPGISTVVEPSATPDHTERLLAAFGADIVVPGDPTAFSAITITGLPHLRPVQLDIPGDPSAAAFAIVAGLIVPGSEVTIGNVLINPARTAFIDTLLEMGGDIQFVGQREVAGEPVADLRVRSSRMKGVHIDAEHAATLRDDVPALVVAAACAHGETIIEGLTALRLGPVDRLAALAAGLAANRITVAEGDERLSVTGDGRPDGGGLVITRGDAGIAMSFLVLGLAARRKVSVDDSAAIAASAPDFLAALRSLGAVFEGQPT